MIRPIDIRLNAAHPELPLAEAVTFIGSPSTVLVRGVPPNCGRWAITAVSVAATFPDGSTTTRAAVQSANGVWVATLPATARSGRTENGLRVMADGIDENGAAVTGYILGVADFTVASLGVTPAPEPGETSWQMLYFDEVPGVLRKGDVTKVDGVLKFYNGTAWEPFSAPVTFDNAVTPTSANGVKSSGIWSAIWGALAALPTGFSSLYDWCVAQLAGKVPTSRTVNGKALTDDVTLTGADIAVSGTDATKISAALAGKASKADATLTERFSAWTIEFTDPPADYLEPTYDGAGHWHLATSNASYTADGSLDATSLDFSDDEGGQETAHATRTALSGYQLGSQTDKPLASEAEAEALRQGKADRAANPTAGNLAALDANGNPTDSTIPAANVALKGDIPYDRITITTGQLQDHAVQKVSLSAASTTLTLPALTDLTGKVSDFGIDMVNAYEVSDTPTAASFTLAGTIGTDYNLIVPKGDNWSEMTALAAGEMAQFYFTLSAFAINGKPTWKVVKQVVQKVTIPTVTP